MNSDGKWGVGPTKADEVDAILAFGREELGVVFFDWHREPIQYALDGKHDGLHVRYRRGGKTTVAYVVNEYLRRAAGPT